MLLIHIGLLLGLLASPPQSDDRTVVAPLQVLRTRHIAVETKINGEGPFRLVLDTGAPITFINRRVAAKIGLITAESAKQPMMLGMAGQVKARTVEVGGAVATDVPVIILDHPIVEMVGEIEGGIDGIIGYTFWGRYNMTLDYQARKVTFAPTNYVPSDVLSGLMGRLMRTDIRPPAISPAGLWGMEATQTKRGVVVKRITPGWPAASGGLHAGDRIKTVNRRWTDTMPDLLDALSYARPGQPAEVIVVRGGKQHLIVVTPGPGI